MLYPLSSCKSLLMAPRQWLAHRRRLLELLRWRAGTMLLGGSAALTYSPPFCEPFARLSIHARERILQSWAHSYIPQLVKVRDCITSCMPCCCCCLERQSSDEKGFMHAWGRHSRR